jgi:predicted RNA binding protein YcfA (HicA-like mRNA interferase family)
LPSQYEPGASAHPVAPQRYHEQDGFAFIERQGSQRVYHHRDGRFVVIHYHRGQDTLPPHVIRNLLTGTRWSEADLCRLKLIK